MRRDLFVFLIIASLVLSLGNAFAGEPPSFGSEIKLGELRENIWQSGMHGLIVDGSNVYAVHVSSKNEVVLDKSNDRGLTWSHSTIVKGSDINESAIAINPVTKELHYAWNTKNPSNTIRNLYYGNGTTTTRVNGSINRSDSGCSNIAVDGKGVIHIVFAADDEKLYYTKSSDKGVTFSSPAPIASGDWISFKADRAGNLYLAYKGSDNYYYFMKKPAGGSWSSSYVACTSCRGNDPSMAVYDSNRIYFAAGSTIAATSDGGKTWTTYTVPGRDYGENSLAVSSNGILNYAWEESGNIYFARTTKSLDPSSWGQPVVALAGGQAYVAVDSAGKAYIMASRNGVAIFTKEK